MTNRTESMVATWSRWLFGPSLPLTMKYAHCMQCTIHHGKQDAKVIFDGYGQHLSTKPTEQAWRAPKKISESISMDRLRRQTFLAKSRKRSYKKFLTNHLTSAWADVQQVKSGAVYFIISFVLGVSNAVFVGNDTDLLVTIIIRATKNAQLLHAPSSSGNTTMFDITRLQNLVSECKNNLLSLHVVTGYDTTLVIYNHGKNKACKQRRYKSCKRCIHFNHTPVYHKGSLFNRYKVLQHLHGAPDFTLLGEFRQSSHTVPKQCCS